MKKSTIITSSIFAAVGVSIVVPPIVIATLPKNSANAIYDTALKQFMEICKIPRISDESGHMDSLYQIRDYIISVAKKHLDPNTVKTDAVGNVWFDIPASKSRENDKKIIYQGHMDMVWACDGEAKNWDQWTHPVADPVIEEIDGQQVIHAKDWLTNLGIDNGNAIALMLSLAINKDKFTHGPIRCVITTNEENGGPGALELGEMADGEKINVISHDEGFDYLINLDTGPLNAITFNSGGGCSTNLNLANINTQLDSNNVWTIKLTGCKGGHSGRCIGLGYVNAIVLIAQALKSINSNDGAVRLVDYKSPNGNSGTIPTEAFATFTSPLSEQELNDIINSWFEIVKNQYPADDNLQISLTPVQTTGSVESIEPDPTNALIERISSIYFGVLETYTNPDDQGTIRVSANVGDVNLDIANKKFALVYTNRFQENEHFLTQFWPVINDGFVNFMTEMEDFGIEPTMTIDSWKAWEGNRNSYLTKTVSDSYKHIGIEPKLVRCHGGVECAEFLNFNPGLDQVSIGPTILYEHNVREQMYLDTYKKEINLLIDIMQNIK